MAEFLEGRQSLGGCGRCLKDCETWPLSGCNVLPSRIWSYVERRSWLVRGEEGRYTEEGTRGKYGGRTRGVIVSDAVFIVVQREEEGRSWKDSSNRSLSKGRTVTIVRRFLSPPRLVSSLVIPFCYSLLVLVIDDHEHQIRGKNSNTSLEQYLAKCMHASEIRRSV